MGKSIWGLYKLEEYINEILIEKIPEGKLGGSFSDFLNGLPYENGIWNLYEIGLIDKAGNYFYLKKKLKYLEALPNLLENSSEDLEPPLIKM